MPIKVNGEIIPEAAVEFELARLVKFYAQHMSREQVREQMPLLKQKAREQAIGAKLLITEAEMLDIEVSEEEVEAKLTELVDSLGGREKLDRMLAEKKMSIGALKAGLTRSCRLDKLVSRITADTPEPKEDEILGHFESHPDEYRKPDRVQARHILIRPDSDSETDKQVARSRIEELRAKIVDGDDFADLAAAHSACPSGRSHGGSLGWVSRGTMVPEFDNALFELGVDTMSDVVETEFGFHIIEKLAYEEGGAPDFEDVRENIREFLRHARRGDVITAHVAELKAKAKIEEV